MSARQHQAAARLAESTPGLVESMVVELLLVRRGWTLIPLRRHAEAEQIGGRVLASAEARGDDQRALDALELVAMARQFGASDPAGALEPARRALAVAERLGEPAALARAHALVGSPTGSLGMIDDSLRHSQEALPRSACAA